MTAELADVGKVVEADVIVLGAGAAGCAAAIAATREGARVAMVEKGKLESAGSLGGGNDHFMAVLNSGPEWDSDEGAVKFLSKAQDGLTAEFVERTWVRMMPVVIKFLQDAGVEFVRNADGSYLRTVGFGQPGSWWLHIKDGQVIKRHIAKAIRSMGVTVVDHVMITKLLRDGERIACALGFDVRDGTFYVLRGKAVVLALGPYAARVTNNSTGYPFNTKDYPFNTGSNNVLAYEVGAKLVNLELGEHATIIPKGFGCPGMNGLNSMGGHELNAFGERFMGKYDPHWENCPRNTQVFATYRETVEGNGPPFYMDMRHLSKEDVEYLQDVLMVGDKATFNDYMGQKGERLATHPLEVEISEIRIGGRLQVDDSCESTVGGLFSPCANFPFLSGAMCAGYSAGTEAARSAVRVSGLPSVAAADVAAEKDRVFQPVKSAGRFTAKEFEQMIRQVMTYYMGLVRNERGIAIALDKLAVLTAHAGDIRAADYHELMRCHEALHLLTQCRLATRAALERKESGRTLYRRSDYPELNRELGRCLVLWQEDGALKVAFESPL